jgi:4-hydroxybenzoate polyprenyltransferase
MMPNKLRYLVYLLRIRRVEFRVAEIPILLIPIILLVHDTATFRSFTFWEGIFVFFLLFAFGDMINCLADRDLDAVYKPHLSEAVYGLGVPFVKFQVAATALLALALTAHLAYQLHRWELLGLVAIGLALGAGYSVKPIQFKGRGLAQVFCLWLIIFVGPMLFIALLISSTPSLEMILFAAAFGALQMGIILVNTAEDYPEDLEARIRTSVVALGLHRGINLAFWLTAAGAIGLIGALGFMFQRRSIEFIWLLALFPAVLTYIYVLVDIGRLRAFIARQELADAIATVKRSAKKVPIWLTAVAWSTVIACFAFFIAGRH